MSLILEEETYSLRGAVFEVYKEMGCGFLEAVYQECLEIEFRRCEVPYVVQPELKLNYKGSLLQHTYKPDFICYDKIVLELKAAKEIAPEHKAQLINYLKATNLKVGLLINFGSHSKVQIERLVFG
ncbi:MAG: GxxExxY protein [Candidatus Riflebacteria bacterium]|nr:GxxExxY protein [Candidatus Riflebacteria bacterium]